MGSINRSNRKLLLNQSQKDKRKVLAGNNTKTDFSKVVFSERSSVMLEEPDGCSRQGSTSHQETTAR